MLNIVVKNKDNYLKPCIQYFDRANVSSRRGRSEVNAFIGRLIHIGIYNQLRGLWFLRDYQNVGTGTTSYSFGGEAGSNGNLLNGPAWGEDGIIFDGLDDRINIPYNAGYNPWAEITTKDFAFGVVGQRFGANAAATHHAYINKGVALQGSQGAVIFYNATDTHNWLRISGPNIGRNAFVAYTINAFFHGFIGRRATEDGTVKGTTYGRHNNTVIAEGTMAGASETPINLNTWGNQMGLGYYPNTTSSHLYGQIAVAYLFKGDLLGKDANIIKFYKETAGIGLGLP